ncbi:MAG: hypothetical protein QCH35_10660 [Methanomicrobiaceae archaeon]|nr:hypothetical protein [Methanomicrobiaceae archaeon]
MDINFCRYYTGDGYPPSNRFCRACPEAWRGCDALWETVLSLARSNGDTPLPLPGTRALLFPHPSSSEFVRLKVNAEWNLPREDLFHFIATGHAGMGRKDERHNPGSSPSMTRQVPYVGAIVALLGGSQWDAIAAVRRVQGRGVPDRD